MLVPVVLLTAARIVILISVRVLAASVELIVNVTATALQLSAAKTAVSKLKSQSAVVR